MSPQTVLLWTTLTRTITILPNYDDFFFVWLMEALLTEPKVTINHYYMIRIYQFILRSGFIDKLVEAEARAFLVKQQDKTNPRYTVQPNDWVHCGD